MNAAPSTRWMKSGETGRKCQTQNTSDAGLMREFEDLLREEFEHYLSEVTLYFRCIDAERARAWREAAEVTAQYGAFLEALRRAPP